MSRPSRPRPSELDSAIVQQAITEGSRSALALLYRHYAGKVRHGVGRAALKAGRARDVDDLNQEVWSRLLRNDRRLLRYYDPSRSEGLGPFIGWVAYQQAWQVLHRQHRKEHGESSSDRADELPDDQGTRFASQLVQSDLLRKLLDEVDERLGDHDRVLLREHHLYERTLRELASELGVSEGALYKRNERLKAKLARVAERLQPTSPGLSTTPTVTTSVVVMLLLSHPGGDHAPPVPDTAPSQALHV